MKTATNFTKNQTPKLRHHKATGQGYVVLSGKTIYLGRYGSQDTTENYHRTISEWLTMLKDITAQRSLTECIESLEKAMGQL